MLEDLIKAKEIIEHCDFDDLKLIVLREKVLVELNNLIMKCKEEL